MLTHQLFVKYHWKQAVTALVVVVAVISFQVVVDDVILPSRLREAYAGQVQGAKTSSADEAVSAVAERLRANISYQNQIKQLVVPYIKARAEFDAPHQDWLFLANNLKYKLLDLSTPDDYKAMHLELVILVNQEIEAIKAGSQAAINKTSGQWAEFLNQFFWIK